MNLKVFFYLNVFSVLYCVNNDCFFYSFAIKKNLNFYKKTQSVNILIFLINKLVSSILKSNDLFALKF